MTLLTSPPRQQGLSLLARRAGLLEPFPCDFVFVC
jgi:hypothetical protein